MLRSGHVVATLAWSALAVAGDSGCAIPEELVTQGVSASLIARADEAATPVCSTGPIRCLAHAVSAAGTGRLVADATSPSGYGPADIQDAYRIDPAMGGTPTVAIVIAYGYTALASDLAVYRAQYGLPACTTATGCLRIVNQQGQAAPLPPNPPPSDDWTIETALDVDAVSAACPRCRLLVVQATDSNSDSMYLAEDAAAALGPAVISNSWGGPEDTTVAAGEAHFDHPGIAIFGAAGDDGYNDQLSTTGAGPDYPGTSAHVISVGATRLVRSATARGWSEAAWAVNAMGTSAGGSACSGKIAKPSYQTDSPCAFKASADVSAVGDPATGLAVYNAANAGWLTVGGTSAASPLVAAMFAMTGHGGETSGEFVARNAAMFNDVVQGSNGTCSAGRLCNAGAGWDGPTGYGTPNAAALLGATGGGGGGGGCAAGGGGAGGLAGLALGLALTVRRRRSCSARSSGAVRGRAPAAHRVRRQLTPPPAMK